jgi:hypothetical protein
MPISEREAAQRLLNRWLADLARDPTTAERMPLRGVLTSANIKAVAATDSYAGFSPQTRERQIQMLRSWMATQRGGLQ